MIRCIASAIFGGRDPSATLPIYRAEDALTTWMISEPQRLSLDGTVTRIDVWLAHGRLNVVATDGPPRVEINKVGSRGVIVSHTDGVLSVRHEADRRWHSWCGPLWWFGGGRRRYQADVSIAVDRASAAGLTLVSGSVVASGLAGDVTVDVVSGGITLLGLAGPVRARTISGSIEALGIGGESALATISGEIVLADASARRVRAHTISGSITCDIDEPRATDIRLDTTSGAITVRVPADADLDVHLAATSGRVTSAFPGVRPGGGPGARSAHGRVGAGTGQLNAYAVSGSISLLARPTEDFSAPTGTISGGDPAGDASSGEEGER